LRRILFGSAKGVQWHAAFVEAGFLNPTDLPKPTPAREEGFVNIPPWPITDYLVSTSADFGRPELEEVAGKFLVFLRAATGYARERGYGNYRVWWQFAKVIANLPPELVRLEDLWMIDYWLDDRYERGMVAKTLGERWLPDLLTSPNAHRESLALGLLDLLYKVKVVERGQGDATRKDAVFRFDDWHAKKLTESLARRAGTALGATAVGLFRARLESMVRELDSDKWSCIWRPAIEEHEQNRVEDTDNILVDAFRDALDGFIEHTPAEATAFVSDLMLSTCVTTRRVGYYAIDQHFPVLRSLLSSGIRRSDLASNLRHEVWHLLNNNYPQFSDTAKAETLAAIDEMVEKDEDGRENPGATAYRRAVWLSAIGNCDNDAAKRHQEYVRIVGGEPEHPDFASYTWTQSGVGESPIPVDELLAMDVDALVVRLKAYRDPGRFGEPGIQGLAKAFRSAVKSEPLRYHNRLSRFLELDFTYVHELVEAFSELWNEKAQLPWHDVWAHLLGFCEALITADRFWAAENAEARSAFVANRYWIVSGISRLIESGTRSDEHAFSEQLLPQAERILLQILRREVGEDFKPDSDAVSVAINSPRGRCIEALLNLTLRHCRLEDQRAGAHAQSWGHFSQIFDSELTRAEDGEYEFVTLLVNYLPNLMYISKEWTLQNLPRMFDESKYQKWLCAMQAYACVSTVYDDVYQFLKVNGHFLRALDDVNLKDRVDEKIVQNIAIAYVNDLENIADPDALIDALIQRRKPPELKQVIWFLWTLRKDGDEKIRRKVLELWPRLLAAADTGSREGRQLLPQLCNSTVFIDKVNDTNRELVLSVAKYADEDHHSSDLLESIARISEQQPAEAYEIWRVTLERSQPDFPGEAVRAALSNLARSGANGLRNAKNIVSKYAARGNDEPRRVLAELEGSQGGSTGVATS
jgi:hypothetical protein